MRPAATPIASRSWTTARWRGSRRQRRAMAGASSGIGAETVHGAHVVTAVRNLAAAEAVRQAVLAETPGASVEVMELDLSSLAFIHKFAADFAASGFPPVASPRWHLSAMYAITKAFCVAFVMTFFSVFAAVPVRGAAATFGGATAAAPKGNLHQTLPHNCASKDQFDTIDLSDNEIVNLENFPSMYRPGSPHLITTYNEREQVTPREHSIRVPAILRSKDEEGVKGCRVAGAVNNYTSQLLTYRSSSQSPSCKSSR